MVRNGSVLRILYSYILVLPLGSTVKSPPSAAPVNDNGTTCAVSVSD